MTASAEIRTEPTLATESREATSRRRPIPATLIVGLIILGLTVIAFVFGPFISPYSPTETDLTDTFAPVSLSHPLGTDNFGRDTLTRILYGGRVDLVIALLATTVTFIFGCILGAIAGYYGRWADTIIMRIVDIVIAFPFLVLMIAIVAMLGPGQNKIVLAIWLIGWIAYTRIIRAEVLVTKQLEYTEAAKVIGNNDLRIMFRHMLPNVITAAIVFAMADMVLNILFAASLGFLGLGVQPPDPELGLMIAEGRDFFLRDWRLTTFPGFAIILIGAGFSFLGDGLADYFRSGGR